MSQTKIILFLAALWAIPASAGHTQDLSGLGGAFDIAQNHSAIDVVGELEGQGYTVLDVNRTFLGRTRVSARNAFHAREVVIGTTTGEVLSDRVSSVTSDAPKPNITFEGQINFGVNVAPKGQ